jgi:hypothetical protein
LQAKDIKERLKSLIQEASTIEPNLARRLEQINRWIKNIKVGSLTAKRILYLFLLQIIDDSEALLSVKCLPLDEQQAAYSALNPTLRYWYQDLFPQWLSQNDPKFYIWRQKLMAGFVQHDQPLLESIADTINKRGGTVVIRYVADLSMATDIIVSSSHEKPLCIQLTSLSHEYSQQKFNHWQNTLCFWEIERGLFLSFNPGATDFINQIANVVLYNSNNLPTDIYLELSL